MTTTVTIKRKQCGPQSEISQDLANKLYNNKGSRLMAIVELKSDHTGESVDGDRDVDLIIESIEPVVDGKLNGALDEHVRTIQQALYRNRALNEGQGELELDGPEPTVAEVLQQGKALIDTDETGQPVGVWDGNTDNEDAADDVDTGDEPHEYEPGPDDSCLHCGRAAHEDYATTAGEAVEDWVDSQHGDEPEPEDDHDETPQEDAATVLAFSGKDQA